MLCDYVNIIFYFMLAGCSVCRNAILGDAVARTIFHPKHVHSSGRLKTIAEKVIASVKDYHTVGYPDWYKSSIAAV